MAFDVKHRNFILNVFSIEQPVITQTVPSKTFTMKTRSITQRETQQEIRERGGYSRDMYRGKPLINRDEKKEKI